ncbi:MAG: hypothetical protein ACK5AZ_24725 [Bryobacteraceae bacterium]
MTERLGVLAGIAILTLAGYFWFPGHTYLQEDTQIYAAILERLHDPSVLGKDPVALHPHVGYTIYDEAALLVRRLTGADFENVLAVGQVLSRALGLAGVFLIATAVRLCNPWALVVAGIFGLGALIDGPTVLTIEHEPIPRGFALPLVFLALGLLGHGRFRLAGIAAGAAILFHPPTVLPFLAVYGAFVLRLGSRERWQPVLPMAASVGLLLLFRKLQPGLAEPHVLFGRLDEPIEALQRMRSTYVWVSLWLPGLIWQYLFLWGVSAAAYLRIRREVPKELRPFLTGLPLFGVLMIPVSYALLEGARWVLMPQLQPARAVLFVTAFAIVLGAVAGIRAAQARRIPEAFLWLALALAPAAHSRVFEILQIEGVEGRRLLVVLGLAALVAAAAALHKSAPALRWSLWAAALAGPMLLLPTAGAVQNFPNHHSTELDALSAWARASTPVEAVFHFPDAGRERYPGIFRARALRNVYVDWKGGGQVNLLHGFAREWHDRWEKAMPRRYTGPDWELYASIGADYIILKGEHRLETDEPVFENGRFVVYRVR